MKRILVADDKATSRELIRTILEKNGYEVMEARDGQEAILKVQETPPDLILLDLQMPALDGFGVLARLRGDSRFASLPIVAVTASAMQGDRDKAIAAGFTSYLTKPVRISLLREELTRLLGEGDA